MSEEKNPTGYPSIDKPWLKYYTEEQINAELPACKIYNYVYEQNKDYQDRIALNYYDRKITYGQMFKGIESAAKAFQRIGVKAGNIVAVVAITLPETIYTFYGLNRIGAISNMIDPRTSIEGIRDYIREVSAKVVVVIDAAFDKVYQAVRGTTIEHIIVISPADSLPPVKKALYKIAKKVAIKEKSAYKNWKNFILDGKSQKVKDTPYRKDECCVIVHTGGTTGMPKGVMLSNDNLNCATFQGINCSIDMQRTHNWLNIMPPFIAYGIGIGLHLPLVIGMEVILIPAFEVEKFSDLLLKYKPIHMVGVPSHYESIIKSEKMKNVDLSYIIAPTVGGDNMKADLEKAVNTFLSEHGCSYKVVKGYGMTEISAEASVCVSNECNKIGGVGVPCSHTLLSIFEPGTDRELGFGVQGEICISGPNTMLGYYGNEKATQEILRKHSDGRIWVHSGDLGYMDEDGQLFIEGRLKRMIVRHDGFKVFPSMIEKTLETDHRIRTCCAVGTDDALHAQGKLPIVYAVLQENTKEKPDVILRALQALCKDKLPEYAQPEEIIFIDSLPLTPIGKVDYRTLEREQS